MDEDQKAAAKKKAKMARFIEDAVKLNLVTNQEQWEAIITNAVATGVITQHESYMIMAALIDFSQSTTEFSADYMD